MPGNRPADYLLPSAQPTLPRAILQHTWHTVAYWAQPATNPERLRELEQARALAPGSPEVRFALATAYAQRGNAEQASAERSEFLRLRDLRKEQAPAKP